MLKILRIVLILVLVALLGVSGLYFYYNKENHELDEKARKGAPGSFIRLSKGYVHYELAGKETDPLIVLIHGAGSGYYAWDNNFHALVNAGHRVLRYDLYGRGLSDRPFAEYNLDLFRNQLNELTDSLHLTGSYDIVSVSMGAMVAIDQANMHPQKVGKIVFVDPAAIDKGGLSWILKTPVLSDLMMTIYWAPRAVEKQMREFHKPEKVSEYASKSEVHLKYKGLTRAMLSTWVNTSSLNMYKELGTLGKKNKPVLLIWGKNDPLTNVKSSVKYRKLIPHTQYHEIDKAGHLANYERPDMVNPLLIKFLK